MTTTTTPFARPDLLVEASGGSATQLPVFLSITVREAKHLPAGDRNGSSDPYVILRLGETEDRTRVIQHTRYPAWEQSFLFKVANVSAQESLQFEVYDEDKALGLNWSNASDDFLALGRVPLADITAAILAGKANDYWIDLEIPLEPRASKIRRSLKATSAQGKLAGGKLCLQFGWVRPTQYEEAIKLIIGRKDTALIEKQFSKKELVVHVEEMRDFGVCGMPKAVLDKGVHLQLRYGCAWTSQKVTPTFSADGHLTFSKEDGMLRLPLDEISSRGLTDVGKNLQEELQEIRISLKDAANKGTYFRVQIPIWDIAAPSTMPGLGTVVSSDVAKPGEPGSEPEEKQYVEKQYVRLMENWVPNAGVNNPLQLVATVRLAPARPPSPSLVPDPSPLNTRSISATSNDGDKPASGGMSGPVAPGPVQVSLALSVDPRQPSNSGFKGPPPLSNMMCDMVIGMETGALFKLMFDQDSKIMKRLYDEDKLADVVVKPWVQDNGVQVRNITYIKFGIPVFGKTEVTESQKVLENGRDGFVVETQISTKVGGPNFFVRVRHVGQDVGGKTKLVVTNQVEYVGFVMAKAQIEPAAKADGQRFWAAFARLLKEFTGQAAEAAPAAVPAAAAAPAPAAPAKPSGLGIPGLEFLDPYLPPAALLALLALVLLWLLLSVHAGNSAVLRELRSIRREVDAARAGTCAAGK